MIRVISVGRCAVARRLPGCHIGLIAGMVVCGSGEVAHSQPPLPTVTITKAAPGPGFGTIDVDWTYSNVTGAHTIFIEVIDPTTMKSVTASPFPAKTPGSGRLQTPIFSAPVDLKIEVRNKLGKTLGLNGGTGVTK